ncbi:MAG: hypothetical protein HOW73_14750 [Polyangiaceae bacterium]|nr:hypothetical protein [Polyangiaceae bacterium]
MATKRRLNDHGQSPSQELFLSLCRELLQSEQSCSTHCRREARRLGQSPPARAMLDLAKHADEVLGTLPDLIPAEADTSGSVARLIGRYLSNLREGLLDRMLEEQQSYRSTLLGLYHGVDTARMLQRVALAGGHQKVAMFCREWLLTREPLIGAANDAMGWFASHPDRAIERNAPGHSLFART